MIFMSLYEKIFIRNFVICVGCGVISIFAIPVSVLCAKTRSLCYIPYIASLSLLSNVHAIIDYVSFKTY